MKSSWYASMCAGQPEAAAERLHVSLSAVDKHVNTISDKLDLPGAAGYSRRVRAILRYLGS